MSRQIKFRVWDKILKYYRSPSEFALGGNGVLLASSSGFYQDFKNVHYIDSLSDYEVEWFTGLKDINGREIYESDIVLLQELGFNGTPSGPKHLCEVFVKEPANSCWFFHARPLPVDEGGRQFSLYNNQYEIVGNIFENPELLK